MPTLTLSLKATTTEVEDDETARLLAAAVCRDSEQVADRLQRPVIKKLFRRGVLKIASPPASGHHTKLRS